MWDRFKSARLQLISFRFLSHNCSLPSNFPYVGITKQPEGLEKRSELRGWSVDRKRCKVGNGQAAYKKAMDAVLKWDNFNFDWFFVSNTPSVRPNAPVVVAAQTLFLWSVLPLKVTWIEKDAASRLPNIKRRMAFGHATLQGHQLAGEEAFAVELHDNGDVWYEMTTVSKPDNLLALLSAPMLRFFQLRFMSQSMDAVKKAAQA